MAAAGAAVHKSGADHVLSEEVGVGVPADPVVNDGLPEALQSVGEVICGTFGGRGNGGVLQLQGAQSASLAFMGTNNVAHLHII